MEKQNDKLTKGDIISFIAFFALGVILFIGLLFSSRNMVLAGICAVLFVTIELFLVFYASYLKTRERDLDNYRRIERIVVSIYVLILIPSALLSGSFFSVETNRGTVVKSMDNECESIRRMFSEFDDAVGRRVTSYQTRLETEGLSDGQIKESVDNYIKAIKTSEYKAINMQKDSLISDCKRDFAAWDLMNISKSAYRLKEQERYFAETLDKLYNSGYYDQSEDKAKVSPYSAMSFLPMQSVSDRFSSVWTFSILGMVIFIVLGLLGLVKYYTSERTHVLSPIKREASDSDFEIII